MRKLLSYSLSILLFLVAFLFFSPQPSFAICGQTGNACGNTIGSGQPGNTYVNCCNQTDTCKATDKDIVGNGTRFQCIPTQLTCTCDNNRSTASGQNGFTCNGNKKAYCGLNTYCHNDSTKSVSNKDIYSGIPLKGIECVANNVVLPPDPGTVPPPDTTGGCIKEGGACGTDTTYSCCSSGGASTKLSCVNNKCTKTACKQEYETCSGISTTTECCNSNSSGVPIFCGNQTRADGPGTCITHACSQTLQQLADQGKPRDVNQCKSTTPTCKANVDDSCGNDTQCCSGPPNYLYCQPAPHSSLGKCQKQDVLSTADLTCKCNSSGDINNYKCYTGTTFYEDRYCTGASPICYDKKTITGADYKEDHGIFCLATAPLSAAPCVSRDSEGRCLAIDSPFGLFNTMPGEFVVKAFSIVLAASGAIAVLLIMRAGYKIMTARGNPEGIQQGREQLVAAIVGLLFLIFSFVFLQVIGVDLLQIPSFTGNSSSIPLNGTCDVNNPKCADGLVCKYNGAQGQCQNP